MTAPEARTESKLWQAATDILSVLGPLSVVTGLLYYFGQARAESFYGYFGVKLAVLDFPAPNFLSGTADPIFRPLAIGLIVAVGLLAAQVHYRRRLEGLSRIWRRRVRVALFALSAALAAFAIAGLYVALPATAPAVALVAAGLLFEYSARFAEPDASSASLLRWGLIVCTVLVGLFWAVSILAHDRGEEEARLLERALPLAPQAVVYSDKDLQLPGPLVASTSLEGADSAYRFRYNGLRQLTYGNGRWFLLPAGWRRGNGATVIVIHDEPGAIRVDLAPGTVRD